MTIDVERRISGLNDYLAGGINSVNGWCLPQLWQTIWPLYQAIGDGPVAEIGVFEVKFMIGLCKTFGTSPVNKAVAIDVFDMQEFNIDGAGVGKRAKVEENLALHGIAEGSVDLWQADSLSLKQRDSDRLLSEIGPIKFFSVDGCHEVAHTVNDIEFAMSVVAHDGIIAVDDYTNPNWPGVNEAIARMYLLRDFAYVPLAVTCNKLLLSSYSFHERNLKAIRGYLDEHFPTTRKKIVKRYGYDTITVQPDINIDFFLQ